MPFPLLDHCEDIALSHNDVGLFVQFNLCSRIFGIDNLLAFPDVHLHFLAVHNAARSYCDDFRLLGFLFGLSRQKPAPKPCPKCGGYMVEKGSRLVCMNESCGHIEKNETDS